MSQKKAQSSSILSVQNVILAAIAWGLIALFIFLLGSPITPRPSWYIRATYIIENIAFFAAILLCFRNWRSSQIVSGRTVWLFIGLGMLCYFTANFLFGWWEAMLGSAPDVSPADFLYLLSYLFLGLGMLLAVISKQLNLSPVQWLIVASIAVLGIIAAYFVGYADGNEEASLPNDGGYYALTPQLALVQPAIAAEPEWLVAQEATAPPVEPAVEPTETAPTETDAVQSPPAGDASGGSTNPAQSEAIQPDAAAPAEASEYTSDVPDWAVVVNERLAPLAGIVWFLYLAGDIFLVVMATILLLAFWGGRFSLSWRFIAAAGFSFYIADMWFFYAISNIENYETGALPEVFWIFSAVLFCIGAALEYSLSTRSRRGRRRA